MSPSLRAKLIGAFSCIVALTVAGGAVSYWGARRMAEAAAIANQRLADANVANQTAFWAVKQYQNQADVIINHDLSVVDDFNASAEKMDEYRDKLADEEYGVEILEVREINGVMDITAVPRMPNYMKGVINLRGKVIPVVDLRLKFGFDEIEHTEQTCIIVVDVGKEIGIIVDTVSEVLDIKGENIEPPPSLGASVDTSFILGMGKVGDEVKILLNIDKVLTSEELLDVASVADATEETECAVGMPAQDTSF